MGRLLLLATLILTGLEPNATVRGDTGQCHDYSHHPKVSGNHGSLTVNSAALSLIPHTAGTGSMCLDGSEYGYYFARSSSGSTKWTIFLMSGGWCYDEQECEARTETPYGSSAFFKPTSECYCNNLDDARTSVEKDCNCLVLPYCDGASFSGHVDMPVRAHGGGATPPLMMRGRRNLDATLDAAFATLGLASATDVVLAGGSAGGHAVLLTLDHVADRVHQEATGGEDVHVHGASYVGFFFSRDPSALEAAAAAEVPLWESQMRNVHRMQNMTGNLPRNCVDAVADPALCVFASVVQAWIQTPIFTFASRFDSWQLATILRAPCYVVTAHHENMAGFVKERHCDAETIRAVANFGDRFAASLLTSIHGREGNGGFVTSCVCHNCPWNSNALTFNGETPFSWYVKWMAGTTAASSGSIGSGGGDGGGAVIVDNRGPNGGSAIAGSNEFHVAGSCLPPP